MRFYKNRLQIDEFVLKANHFVLTSTSESSHVPHDMAAWRDDQVLDAWDDSCKMQVL